MHLASESPYRQLTIIPTGLASVDKVTGIGGIPTRKITEVSGLSSVGKSTLALMTVALAQQMKMPCLYADIEFAFEELYAQKLGVNLNALDLIQEHYAETAIDEIEAWADTHKNALIVVDAIGGLLPRQEAEKAADGRVIGGQAKLVASFCRKLVPLLAINNIALLVLNHQFIDIMTGKLKTSGGMKLEYHRSMWLMLRKANKRVMQGGQQVGDIIEVEVRKNKLSDTLHQKCELTLLYGQGFYKQADAIEQAIEKGVITKKGQFYWYEGQKIARGMAALREKFTDEVFASKFQ